MKNWLKEVYKQIEEDFDSQHLPRVAKLVRQPSIAGTGEGIPECAQLVCELLEELVRFYVASHSGN